MYCVKGMTEKEIAEEEEGTSQSRISECLALAQKKKDSHTSTDNTGYSQTLLSDK